MAGAFDIDPMWSLEHLCRISITIPCWTTWCVISLQQIRAVIIVVAIVLRTDEENKVHGTKIACPRSESCE